MRLAMAASASDALRSSFICQRRTLYFVDNIRETVAQPASCQCACTIGAIHFLERQKDRERETGRVDKENYKQGGGGIGTCGST
jgi:hypothetical protein